MTLRDHVNGDVPPLVYEDILDEDFEIPLSQNHQSDIRLVFINVCYMYKW